VFNSSLCIGVPSVLDKGSTRHPLSTHTALHRSSNGTVLMCSLDLTGLNTFLKINNLRTVLRFLMFSQHRFDHNKNLKQAGL